MVIVMASRVSFSIQHKSSVYETRIRSLPDLLIKRGVLQEIDRSFWQDQGPRQRLPLIRSTIAEVQNKLLVS
jgi:hypothetical protein